MMLGKTSGDVNQTRLLAVNGRGDKLFDWAVDDPMALPTVRIVTSYTLITGQDHLWSSSHVSNNRSTVTAGPILARCFPENMSVAPVERDQIRVAVMVTVQNDLIPV